MRILVVCGAGASSTFVAQRVRRAAQDAGLPWTAIAGTEQSFPIDLDAGDVILVGPHLADALPRIEQAAGARMTTVVLLPDDIFADLDGTRTLDLVRRAVAVTASDVTASDVTASGVSTDAGAEDPAHT